MLLPKRAKFITSIFKGDNISEFSGEKQRLWVEILNKWYQEELKIERGSPLGFVVIGPEHLKFNHETQTTTKTEKRTNSLSSNPFRIKPKTKKRNLGGSLNRYGFAYARRYKFNQVAKAAPGVIKAAPNDINNIAEKRTNQIINEGEKQS